MKSKLFLTIYLLVIAMLILPSCAKMDTVQQPVFKNTVTTNLSYDEVWDKVVDFFAESGVNISTIEKASGIIVASKTPFNSFTFSKGGVWDNPNALILLSSDAPNKNGWSRYLITGDWNVRVKTIEGQVSITINLYNLVCAIELLDGKIKYCNAYSTGKFEGALLDLFK